MLKNLLIVFLSSMSLSFLFQFFYIPNFCSFLIIGYLVKSFNLIESLDLETLGTLGVLCLFFSVGLEISFKNLKSLRHFFLPAIMMIFLTSFLGFLVLCFLIDFKTAIYLSITLSLSSTAIIILFLRNNNQMNSNLGKMCLTILVLQDFIGILMLFFIQQSHLLQLFIGFGIFLIFSLIINLKINKFINFLYKSNKEIFLLFIPTFLFLFCIFSEHIGLSMEMGALFAGILLANTQLCEKIEISIEFIKEVFLMFFFIETGKHIHLSILAKYPFYILFGILGFILIKILGIFLNYIFFNRFSALKFLSLSLILCNISESSFLIIYNLYHFNLLSKDFYEIILFIGLVSLIISPIFLIIANAIEKHWVSLSIKKNQHIQILIIGVNLYTLKIAKKFSNLNIPFLIIEKNLNKILEVKELGYKSFLADFFLNKAKFNFNNINVIIFTNNVSPFIEKIIQLKKTYQNLTIITLTRDERSHNLLIKNDIISILTPSEAFIERIIQNSTSFLGFENGKSSE